jgi:membrane protease YdiL (CAAX protease family)
VALLAMMVGLRGNELTVWLQDSTLAQFLSIAAIAVFNVLIITWFLKRSGISLQKIGVINPRARDIAYALVGFIAYFIIYIASIILISNFVPGLNVEQEQEIGFKTGQTGLNLWLVFVSLVILPPLIEEFIMRGFLFSGLRQRLKFVYATAITSILFALAHLPAGKEGLLWVGAIDTFILSGILCYMREKTGSIAPGIGVHALKNGLAFSVLFIFPDFLS